MATPCCPKCGNHNFEIQEIKVRDANFRTNAINCSSCGAVIGIQEYFNINVRLCKLAEKLRINLDE